MQKFTLQNFLSPQERDNILNDICKQPMVDIMISYESDFRNAKILRELMDDVCTQLGVSSKWRTRIVLIIDELNNNAIEYGSCTWDINKLQIRAHKDEGGIIHLNVSVTDTWTWSHAKTAQEMEILRQEHQKKDFQKHRSVRGRWLFLIITRLVDSLTFDNDEKWWLRVQIEKCLQENSEK